MKNGSSSVYRLFNAITPDVEDAEAADRKESSYMDSLFILIFWLYLSDLFLANLLIILSELQGFFF
jgi:hypothetical protein